MTIMQLFRRDLTLLPNPLQLIFSRKHPSSKLCIMATTRKGSGATRNADLPPPAKKLKQNKPSQVPDDPSARESGTTKVEETLECQCDPPQQAKRKGKAKAAAQNIDPSTFLKRAESPWMVGAHVSTAKGIENAVTNAADIGANAFALFVKSQRKWISPDLTEHSINEFKARMEKHRYTNGMVLAHGSYLINLGNPDPDSRAKSYACFVDDLKRCEALGIELYNFHPGSTVGKATTDESLTLIADCINRAHQETRNVIAVLENMAGAGNIVGSEFSHLAGIIERVEDKSRIGVCIDTCHAFAAGYDIRTKEGWESTMKEFNETIGVKYLRGMHLNDSKTVYKSKKDRHENIGLGYLGLNAFHHVLTDSRTQGIPLILETPSFEQPKEVWGKEIEIIQRLSGNVHGESGKPDLDGLATLIKSAVKEAEKKSVGPKTKKPAKPKAADTKRKRKASDEDDEATEEDD